MSTVEKPPPAGARALAEPAALRASAHRPPPAGARALILGASGYGGGELLRLLAQHPLGFGVRGVSRNHAGKPLFSQHPNLRGVVDGVFDAEPDWGWLAEGEVAVVFAAMPHLAFAGQYEAIEGELAQVGLRERVLIIDLSGDFRLDDAAVFEAAYGERHPCPERLAEFVYGLAEINTEAIRATRRVANPGCFSTAANLALAPFAGESSLGFVAIDGKTGSSGSGATPEAGTHHPTRANDFRAYKMLAHRHEAEIAMVSRQRGWFEPSLSFVPHSAPMIRGIFDTLHLLFNEPVSEAWARERLQATYGGRRFVRVVEGSPRVAAVTGSNFCDIGVAARGKTLVVMSALDNLVKGMAGQAIQNMNLMLGRDESDGLRFAGTYPG